MLFNELDNIASQPKRMTRTTTTTIDENDENDENDESDDNDDFHSNPALAVLRDQTMDFYTALSVWQTSDETQYRIRDKDVKRGSFEWTCSDVM